MVLKCPISLEGNIHWLAYDIHRGDVVVSTNVYYSIGTGSIQCCVTPFPDSGKPKRFKRTCTTSQGFLMYMNIISVLKVDGSLEDKLCVWRLKSGEWQLVSEVTPSFIDMGFDYFPLGINPFDAKTVYFWSTKHQSLMSINLCNGKYEATHIISSVECGRVMEYHKGSHFS
ncbi:F-box protein [Cardamine amara subsp. amara]|uniref:F-box protein n=1 Tax=Cardamine amara subsp. amara TaxID=228776 RepID=A0ABD1A2A1_CARAN